MEHEISLPFSKYLTACPYTETNEYSPNTPTNSSKIQFNIIFLLHPSLSSENCPPDFPTKSLYIFPLSPMRDTCPIYPIILVIFDEWSKFIAFFI
jgi:hypothetical protein